MARYPDPVRFARERARHAGISLDRRERVQRGEGSRLRPSSDGLLRPGRVGLAGDAPVADGGPALFTLLRDPRAQFEDDALERLAASAVIQRCLLGLTDQQTREWMLVDGLGFEVKDVAAMLGQCRETVSRRLSKTRRVVQQNRVRFAITEGHLE